MAPCCHIFCLKCHENRLEHRDKCPECHVKVVLELKPFLIDSITEKFREKKKIINEYLKNDLLKNSF